MQYVVFIQKTSAKWINAIYTVPFVVISEESFIFGISVWCRWWARNDRQQLWESSKLSSGSIFGGISQNHISLVLVWPISDVGKRPGSHELNPTGILLTRVIITLSVPLTLVTFAVCILYLPPYRPPGLTKFIEGNLIITFSLCGVPLAFCLSPSPLWKGQALMDYYKLLSLIMAVVL